MGLGRGLGSWYRFEMIPLGGIALSAVSTLAVFAAGLVSITLAIEGCRKGLGVTALPAESLVWILITHRRPFTPTAERLV